MADYGGWHVMTLAGTAITGTSAATSVTVGTVQPIKPLKMFIITNSCNQPISLCFGKGSTNGAIEVLRIEQASMVLDFGTNYVIIEPNTVVSAFSIGTVPTSGELTITAIN